MSFNIFGGGGNASAVKLFDIRIEEKNIVLRGDENEAASAMLRGVVVLCLSEPLRVVNIHLRLTGEARVSWPVPANQTGAGKSRLEKRREFYNHMWTFESGNGKGAHTLAAGNYEYPFELVVKGDMPESVEGLDNSWIIYRLKATIERGLLQQNIHRRQHVRIIRTLDPSALELAHEMSVENIWPNKIDYTIRTPVKAVIFGTQITTEFRLSPLLKGLKIGKITSKVEESQEFTIEGISVSFKAAKNSRVIAEDTYEIPEGQETVDYEGQESFHFERTITLPRSLTQCIQDTDIKGIKIRHKMRYNIQLHNPDGHTSELRATLPVTIFLSPNLPLDDSNRLVDGSAMTITSEDISQVAPPKYGEHQFDQLYNDIDTSGFNTHGVNTPFLARSRNASIENLASMDALTESQVAPAELEERLTNLQNPGLDVPPQENPAVDHNSVTVITGLNTLYNRSGHSSSTQTPTYPLSRRHSQEDGTSGTQTPRTVHLEMEALSRVPSYSTAVRTPAIRTPYNDQLPDYRTATSAPPSPPRHTPPPPSTVVTDVEQNSDDDLAAALPARPPPVRLPLHE